MKKIILSTAVILGLSTAAFAQGATDFATVDADASGELSLAELQVVWPDLGQQEFTTADADASGGLSTAELGALQPPTAATPAPTDNTPALAPTDAPPSLTQ